MFPNNIIRLWKENKHIPSVREAIADTLMLALDMKAVFTENQINYAINFYEQILGIKKEDRILYWVKYSNLRFGKNGQTQTMEHIAERVQHLSQKERESILMLAIIYFHLSDSDEKRKGMSESFLPHFSIALGVHESVPKVLKILRGIVGPKVRVEKAA